MSRRSIKALNIVYALLLLCAMESRGNPLKSHEAPVGKETADPVYLGPVEALAPLEVPELYRHGSRNSRKIALTIDDGWVEDEPLLELLATHKIPCTVFIPGKVLQSRPEWVKKLDKMGFEVANHTYGHKFLTYLTDEEIEADVKKAQALLTGLTGKTFPYLRPSGGNIDDRVLRVLAKLGYIVVLWDNDVLGYWKDRPIDTQFQYLRENKKNGNIILSHFGSALRTAEVLKIIIPEMLAEGYEFVTVTELLREMKTRGSD